MNRLYVDASMYDGDVADIIRYIQGTRWLHATRQAEALAEALPKGVAIEVEDDFRCFEIVGTGENVPTKECLEAFARKEREEAEARERELAESYYYQWGE